MLTKLILTSIVLPFVMKTNKADRFSHLPVEMSRPLEGVRPPVHSPREKAPLAVSYSDQSRHLPDAFVDRSDLATSQIYWENLDGLKPAATREFVRWLRRNDITRAVTQRELWTLYLEHCEYMNRKPLSERRLLNAIKDHGIETFRPSAKVVDGRMTRPTMYRVKNGRAKQ